MNKSIKVHNISTNRYESADPNSLEFRISIYGILIENDQLLVHTDPRRPRIYDLPGGQIERGELMEASLVREFKEETGLEIRPKSLRTVKESFVNFGGDKSYHSILIFYDVERIGGKLDIVGHHEDSSGAKFVVLDSDTNGRLTDVFRNLL